MAPSETASDGSAADTEITLELLAAVDRNHLVTQRGLAKDLGIALGLANGYLKRCVKKGLIKITTAPANRYAYYLTPQGFAEKSRLTAEFLTQSFKLFRIARIAYCDILRECERRGMRRIAVIGGADLTEIILIGVRETSCEVVRTLATIPVNDGLLDCDAILLADLTDPQRTYELLVERYGAKRVMAPEFLNISRHPAQLLGEAAQ